MDWVFGHLNTKALTHLGRMNDNIGLNLLPFDGGAYYFKNVLEKDPFTKLEREISWKPDIVKMFGKTIETKRLTAWYGKKPFIYTYSGMSKTAIIFTPFLKEIESQIAKICGFTFNSCLLNSYRDGNEGMSYHRDNERTLVEEYPIASLSFGAERKFQLKHRETGKKLEVLLENNSMLLMTGAIQEQWLHALPKSKKVTEKRINLTFRQYFEGK
ncbi:MAG: Uncharacterised protein [Bacteroidetes bacterium MED-G17]|nr:MAG: Uncharacterised protein [Bacteroidetes bacterium MED-G17]